MVLTKIDVDAKTLGQRLQDENQAYRRAVRIGDDIAAGFSAPGLILEYRQMIGIDFGNDQRHILVHAEGAGIGNDGATRRRERRL